MRRPRRRIAEPGTHLFHRRFQGAARGDGGALRGSPCREAGAERAAVKEAHAARLPELVSFVEGAAVPLAGLTALQALRDLWGEVSDRLDLH